MRHIHLLLIGLVCVAFLSSEVLCKVTDPYRVLGLKRDASDAEVRSAYKQLAKKWHPDKNDNSPESNEKYLQISEAYEILTNEDLKLKFTSPFPFQYGGGQGVSIELTQTHLVIVAAVIFGIVALISKCRRAAKPMSIPGSFNSASIMRRIVAGMIDSAIYNLNYNYLLQIWEKVVNGHFKALFSSSYTTIALLICWPHIREVDVRNTSL